MVNEIPEQQPPSILVVTTFFPNVSFPYRTLFVRNLVCAMRELAPVEIISPVPYAPPGTHIPRWQKLRAVASRECIDEFNVEHPRYVAIPGIDALSGFTYAASIRDRLRMRFRERGSFLIHAHCAYPDGVGVARVAMALGLPYVITAHGSDINVYAEKPFLRSQIRKAFAGACGVIAVSQDLEKKIAALDTGVPVERIPCAGFDPKLFVPQDKAMCRAELGLAPEEHIVLFVGNLVPVKGLDTLLEAWSLLSDYRTRLVIVGEGTERQALESRASTLSNVQFVGALPQAKVAQWLAAANVLTLPSQNEGMPNVVVESLASGVPVVASRVGGIPELVRDGVNGFLVSPGEPSQLSQALKTSLQRQWEKDSVRASVSQMTWSALATRNLQFLTRAYAAFKARHRSSE